MNGTRAFGIHREIINLVQGTNYVAVYFNKLKALWDEINALVSLPPPNSASAKVYLEHLNQKNCFSFLWGSMNLTRWYKAKYC